MSSIKTLLETMRMLRDKDNGCPWDIEQTFESLSPCVIEEASSITQGESDSKVCSISHGHPLSLSRSMRIVSSKVLIEDIRNRLYLHTLLDETLRFQRSVQQLALF